MRRVKEGTSAVLLQSGLDEKWWADSMECFSYLRNIQDLLSDVENLSKDQSFRLVHWLSFSLSLRKTSQESISLERKSYLDCSLDTLWGLWKGDIMEKDIEELETMDASEIYSKKINAKEVIFPKKKMENLFFQSQMDESNFLEEIKN